MNNILNTLMDLVKQDTFTLDSGKISNNRKNKINTKKPYSKHISEMSDLLRGKLNANANNRKNISIGRGISRRKNDGETNGNSDKSKVIKMTEIYRRPEKTSKEIPKQNVNKQNNAKRTENVKPSKKSSTKKPKKSVDIKCNTTEAIKEGEKKTEKRKVLPPSDGISLNNNTSLKRFWNRSSTSVKLIKNLSSKLEKESLTNLLQVRNDNIDDGKKTALKKPNETDKNEDKMVGEKIKRKTKEDKEEKTTAIEHEGIINNNNQIAQGSTSMNVRKVETLYLEQNDFVLNELEAVSREREYTDAIKSGDNCMEAVYNENMGSPSLMTVKDMSDMIFSVAVILERLPQSLKSSRLADLGPPESLFQAVTILDNITKSLTGPNK